MASFNGSPITKFGVTPSAAASTEQDIKATVLAFEPNFLRILQDVTPVSSTGMKREFVREDLEVSLTCQKTTDTAGAWEVFKSDTGELAFDIEFSGSSGPTGGDLAFNAVVESVSAPFGADGNQAITVSLKLSGSGVTIS